MRTCNPHRRHAVGFTGLRYSRAVVLALLCIVAQPSCCSTEQQAFDCTLLLRGYGGQQQGIAEAALNCNSTGSGASHPEAYLPIAINTTHLKHHFSSFTGVRVISNTDCNAQPADQAMTATHRDGVEPSFSMPRSYPILLFCLGNITFHQPIVESIWLNHTDQSTPVVLGFAGDVSARILGGSFRNNNAGPQLHLQQRATVGVQGGSVFHNNTARTGAAAVVTDQANLRMSNGRFSNLQAKHYGGAVLASGNATIIVRHSSFSNNTVVCNRCIAGVGAADITLHNSSCIQSDDEYMYPGGSAIYAADSATVDISSSSFAELTAIAVRSNAVVSVTNSTFVGITTIAGSAEVGRRDDFAGSAAHISADMYVQQQ